MDRRLTRAQRLALIAELCPRAGRARPCDDADRARAALERILGPAERAKLRADLVLMRAIDRYVAGELSLDDLYRSRILAYYLVFAAGGEEWERWGVAASVRPGARLDDDPMVGDSDEEPPFFPPGPPWARDG